MKWNTFTVQELIELGYIEPPMDGNHGSLHPKTSDYVEEGIPLVTAAGSYGAHLDIMGDYDLVILAPQVASYYEDLKKDADRMGVKCIACEGKQYIDLTRNPKGALEFVVKSMGE